MSASGQSQQTHITQSTNERSKEKRVTGSKRTKTRKSQVMIVMIGLQTERLLLGLTSSGCHVQS